MVVNGSKEHTGDFTVYLLATKASMAGAKERKQMGLGSFLMMTRTSTGKPVNRDRPIITAAAMATFCINCTVSVEPNKDFSTKQLDTCLYILPHTAVLLN